MSDFHDNINRISGNLRALEAEGTRLALPTRDGLLGRACPACQGFFEIETDIEDFEDLTCPYCGTCRSKSEFFSESQLRSAREAMAYEAQKAIGEALGQSAGPAPVAVLDPSEKTDHEVRCSACSLRFGANGEAKHCPRCGADPS